MKKNTYFTLKHTSKIQRILDSRSCKFTELQTKRACFSSFASFTMGSDHHIGKEFDLEGIRQDPESPAFAERPSAESPQSKAHDGFQCPANFHQVTIYMCVAPGIKLRDRVTQFASSALLVVFQIVLVTAVARGISLGNCSSNEDCGSIGTWCSPDLMQSCEMCGYISELPPKSLFIDERNRLHARTY